MTYIYHIDEDPTGIKSTLAADLQWTTEPPTQEGWYWVKVPNSYDASRQVDIYYFDGVGWGYTPQEYVYVQSKPTHWLGPLPVPEPPKE